MSLSDLALTPGELAQVILDVERSELGISAGLQDRVVQSIGGLVHMDFSCFTPASHPSSASSFASADDVAAAASTVSTGGLFPSLMSPMKFMSRSTSASATSDNNNNNNNNNSGGGQPSDNKSIKQKQTPTTTAPVSPKTKPPPKELVVNKDGTLSSASVTSPGAPSLFPSKLLASCNIPFIQTGVYTSLNPTLLPPLYLAYNTVAGGDSGQVHSTVKERWAKRYTLIL